MGCAQAEGWGGVVGGHPSSRAEVGFAGKGGAGVGFTAGGARLEHASARVAFAGGGPSATACVGFARSQGDQVGFGAAAGVGFTTASPATALMGLSHTAAC